MTRQEFFLTSQCLLVVGHNVVMDWTVRDLWLHELNILTMNFMCAVVFWFTSKFAMFLHFFLHDTEHA